MERDAGTSQQSKDAAVAEFQEASEGLDLAVAERDLTRAQQKVLKAKKQGDGGQQLEAAVAACDAEVRALRSRTKLALSSLARFEPDFPEVMVLLESALPRELLGVWRPDSALEEMFPEREEILGGRHVVWRCSDGEDGVFAVKVGSYHTLRCEPRTHSPPNLS